MTPITSTLSLPTWTEAVALRVLDNGSVGRFVGRVFSKACVRFRSGSSEPLPAWRDHPRHMMRVRAEVAALGCAFPEVTQPEHTDLVRVIDGRTGEFLEHPPRHLSSEDIAAGIAELPGEVHDPLDDVDLPF